MNKDIMTNLKPLKVQTKVKFVDDGKYYMVYEHLPGGRTLLFIYDEDIFLTVDSYRTRYVVVDEVPQKQEDL